jgi:hypothetical protein
MVRDFLELITTIPDSTPHLFKKLLITNAPFDKLGRDGVFEVAFVSLVAACDAVVDESDVDINAVFERSFSLTYKNNSF